MKWLTYGVAGLVGLLSLFLVTMFAMGRRADAGRIRTSTEINRPPEEVWKWLEEPEKFKQWVSWVSEVRDEGPNGVGGRRSTFMKDPNMGGQAVRVDSVVREHALHRKLAIDLSSPLGFTGHMVYTLEDLGGGRTRLLTDSSFVYQHWFANLMEPVVTPQARQKMEGDLATMKTLAEK